MSDNQNATDTSAQNTPAQPQPPAAPAPEVAAPPAQPPTQPNGDPNPPWLPDRLSRAAAEARAQTLKELGIEDPDKAKEIISAAQKAEDDAKSAAEKLGETNTKLTQIQTEAERYKAVTKEWATRQMMGLTEEQKAAVNKIAGDDPAKQLEAITVLAPTWAQAAAAAASATPPATPPAPATPPTGTAPPKTAPAEGGGSPPNHQEVHAALFKTNPFAAANYALTHPNEVFPTKT